MDVWGGAFGRAFADTFGLQVTVVTRSSDYYGGDYHARVAKDFEELRLIIAQIEREDEEILAVIVAAVHAGIIP